jgi:hypothetical protein
MCVSCLIIGRSFNFKNPDNCPNTHQVFGYPRCCTISSYVTLLISLVLAHKIGVGGAEETPFDRISCARNWVESAFEFRYPRLKTTPKTIARKLTFRSLPASQHEKAFRKPDFLAVLDRVT